MPHNKQLYSLAVDPADCFAGIRILNLGWRARLLSPHMTSYVSVRILFRRSKCERERDLATFDQNRRAVALLRPMRDIHEGKYREAGGERYLRVIYPVYH